MPQQVSGRRRLDFMLPCWLAASFLAHSCNPSWILEGTKHNDILFGHFNQFDFPAARDRQWTDPLAVERGQSPACILLYSLDIADVHRFIDVSYDINIMGGSHCYGWWPERNQPLQVDCWCPVWETASATFSGSIHPASLMIPLAWTYF